MDPLVSVVVPCYNRARTVALCIQSVQAQTYPAIEIIVVDDASSDGSAAIAESTGATVLRLETNSGPGAARNLGAEHANGDILFFLDADVALRPGSIAAAVAELRAEPRLGAICGVLLPESLLSHNLIAEYRALQMYHWWLAQEGAMQGLHTALCAMRTEVFREIGPFNPDLRHTEAPEYGYRIQQRYDVRSTAAIAGIHDHDTTLRVLLPKVFLRARASTAEVRPGEVLGGAASRVLASGLTLVAGCTIALPLIAGRAAALVPLLAVILALALDAPTYRRVFTSRGTWFGLRFTLVHLLYQLVSAAGASIGAVERLLGRTTAVAPDRPVGVPR